LARRIRNLKGPIKVRTFISLTCENCPDVVQALNQMAIIHGDFEHEMIDGMYHQTEVERLNIQGVPSVMVGDQLLHSGRSTFIELLGKLESHYGTKSSGPQEDIDLGKFDVVVLGGGPAGASAAIYSVRKGLKTAVLAERLGGQVQDTKGIENLISVSYTEGPQLAAQLNKHMSDYPIQIFENRRVERVDEKNKIIYLIGGEKIHASSIIVATGAKWRELNVPGEKEYIGRGVAFCPHCDGPYYKGKKVAVIGGGNSGVEAAIDLAGIVKEVVLVEYNDQLKADKVLVDKLKSLNNVSILTNAKTLSIEGDGAKVHSLKYENRENQKTETLSLEGVFVQIGLIPNSQFLREVVKLSKYGEVIVDEKGRTSVPGIYAAGDVTTVPYKQIIIAMGEGAKAALAAFEDRMVH
jgi:alkyl hydroperoxide reductase subunit F